MPMEGAEKGKSLVQYFQELERKHSIRFYFVENWIDKVFFEESFENKTLRIGLDELFAGTDLTWMEIDPRMVVIIKDPSQELQRNRIVSLAQREQKKIDRLIIGKYNGQNAKGQVTLVGKVVEAKLNAALAGVSVYATDLQIGTITNNDGKYELRLPAGPHILNFSHVNYEDRVTDLEIYENGKLDVTLEEVPTVLDEFIVTNQNSRNFLTNNLGLTMLTIAAIKKAPAMFGEVDLIKQIQALPGVTTVGEAASGFNVRGGSADQNLILYDGLPVFNSSHVFGFFSTFNAEAIRDAAFYKGGIPAEFGGRTSSVLDIRSKEGSYEKWQGSAGIGVVSSNILAQGPIVKDKTSIIASVRTTYSDWVINTVRSNYINLDKSKVSFYDGSVKLTHLFSQKTKLTLSSYVSHDQFRLRGDTTFRWDTQLNSVKLDHTFTKAVNASFMIGYGKYSYVVFDKDPLSGFDLSYTLRYPTAKVDFYIQKEKHEIILGAQSIYYDFSPGTLKPSSLQSDKKFIEMDKQQSIESGFHASDRFDITQHLHADVGLRFSIFQALGPGQVFTYQEGRPREILSRVDTLQFGKGKTIKTYFNWEPRLSFRYDLSPFSSLKLGYNRMYQYLHLITNTTAITPVDIWQPSGYYFKPQLADQISLGYNHSFKSKGYDLAVEVYYKKMHNVLDFKDGAVLLLNPQLETDLLQGDGRSYGAEAQVIKNTGRLSGSLSYAYARSFRTIRSAFPEESVNNGKEYKSNFDQPNVVTVQWKYNITRRYFFTGAFTYHTGRPITLPQSAFSAGNFTVSAFSDRNEFRVPDYHRLDLAIGLDGNHKRKKLLYATWTFSVYNVYGRKNPYSVFFQEARPGILRPYQLAIIGTMLPSLSVSIKF
ncbi:MAG: TonB-dependent receptor [Bacteroidetes bacterium]|nr:TonB-dependent receptor [Bacteroidota bacterium]